MAAPVVYFWRKSPFVRLLLPFMVGIVIQWHSQIRVTTWWILLIFSLGLTISFFLIPFFQRYKLAWVSGIFISMLFFSIGAILTWYKDIHHNSRWFGNLHPGTISMVAALDEPLIEKTKSFKANAKVNYIIQDGKAIKVKGKIILYLKKDSAGQTGSLSQSLAYGTQIIFETPLQEIKNSGNPGGFDYKRYSLFQGITHQVFLKPGEFGILEMKDQNPLKTFLYSVRQKVLNILRANIKGDKESGLAGALLIGYKDDLDKTLVQSYSNTGVVHVIAISGLHIGLIYWLLLQLLRPLRKRKYSRWLQPLLIITGLWLFSLLAGGQPSVLRSAVMFTCIVLGQAFSRKTSIYNTLAFSAFLILCYNPYWLWDVGFQLSYSAVLSIIIFMKPIYNWLYIKNKILDFIWKLNAVTLAAQILTLPVSIYHFHQFPDYFLLTNFIAVPLSSVILLGEILLCVLSFIPFMALLTGKLLSWLIMLMNSYVEKIEALPFSLWDGLQINIIQTILLFLFIAGVSFWLMEKRKPGLTIALVSLLGFFAIRSYSFMNAGSQKKIIVYNVPQHRAIDFIDGRSYLFYGDSDLLADDFVRNFHLRPSRISSRISSAPAINNLIVYGNYAGYKSMKILLADTAILFSIPENKQDVDLLIISKNPKLYISQINKAFNIKQVVFDGSVPAWKLNYWKKDCDSLHIPYYDVNEKGAFVMNLE
jgi:competence protein ComEC